MRGSTVTSGNSLAGYVMAENVLVPSKAVQKSGRYPLAV